MTPSTRSDEGRTSPAETKLAGNGETVADEAVERARKAVRGQGWTQTYGLDSRETVAAQIAHAALTAAGYFALQADALRYRELIEMHSGEFPQFREQLDAVTAERDALRRDARHLASAVRKLIRTAEAAESALAAERERAEANEQDARRYRWLRDRPRTHSDWSISVYTANPTYGVTQWLVDGVSDELQTERLDAAINAALAAQEGK
jgi:hypothetical protein